MWRVWLNVEATERVAGGEENDLGEGGEKSFFTKIKCTSES